MIPGAEQIRAATRAASSIRTLPQTFVIVWLSVVALAGLLVRPAIIQALGARYWLMSITPLYVLLFSVLVGFIVLGRKNPRAFK